ncbi:esterase/lipase/thioesterase [Trichodelitschia bisporula]|uniref:Esterase/lipase/thioesterase n=1 Tax=Trichodelitschia bisporula TaxID=703511 RepID=A0A6G1I9K4_9PEZI|nr:esterase/lipase/thioesterase [Trichodelitschia bisporula]
MSLQSDLSLSAAKFDPAAVPAQAARLNGVLLKVMSQGPTWNEVFLSVGAARYREMRWNNETALPRPPVLESGINATIPSRDKGRDIPIRRFKPEGEIRGTFMHIHGGGWVLQSEAHQDTLLKAIADMGGLAVVSVGYRLAPEHPFPAAPDDCVDVANYLIENAEREFGGPLRFFSGESAGGHLSLLTYLHVHANPKLQLAGLVLHFGCYELSSFLPSSYTKKNTPIVTLQGMQDFIDAFLPNTTEIQRRDPLISPLWADWVAIGNTLREAGGKLPPILFTVGTEDPLLDDSVFMAAKWQMAGGEAILKVYPGAPHGFILFEEKVLKSVGECLRDMKAFFAEKLAV